MKKRPILIGCLLALLGAALHVLYIHRFEQTASGGAKIDLLVAAQPIERGMPMRPEMLAVRSVPQAYVDDRAVRASDREKVLSLRAVSKVPVLQTLAWTDLIAPTDEQRDLSSLVQPGNRATPLRVQFDETLQLIRPGDFVDIMSVDSDLRKASVLLQRVLVLAAGLETTAERPTDKQSSARSSLLTVSVSLQEAQFLILAQSLGKLTVVVRGNSDPRVVVAPPDVSREEFFDSTARQAVQRANHKPTRLRTETY